MANTSKSYIPSLSGAVDTATGAAHAETLNAQAGIITTEALTTASAATESRTLTNDFIASDSVLIVQIAGGTNTRHGLIVDYVCAAGSATINITNTNASAVNGTLKYSFIVL